MRLNNNENNEAKQAFLSSAIEDISSNIHLTDTKVSIIMAAVTAIMAAIVSCSELIMKIVSKATVHSCSGNSLLILGIMFAVCLIAIFVFGILTIRNHTSKFKYKSKWYLPMSNSKYSFEDYINDICLMSDDSIVKNMAAELYILNDINRQKQSTYNWVLRSFSVFLIISALIIVILLVIGLKG